MNSNKSRSCSGKRRAESPPSSQTGDTKGTTRTTSTTAYSRNFQQNLIDHGVYPPEYRYPDRRKPSKPSNWTQINERLAQPRASLSPSKLSEDRFEGFREADAYASKEKPVTNSVVPILDGDVGDPKCVGGDYLFGNLAPLTDGTLAQAKPDHFYGARPEQLDRQIRNELSDHIIPSTQDDLPMLYTTHLTEPEGPGHRPEYIMTQLNTLGHDWELGNVSAREHAHIEMLGDWAKEKRGRNLLGQQMETHSKASSQLLSSDISKPNGFRRAVSYRGRILDVSDVV
ncbi:predicted protein [Histoplasma mississippiense (nom. inval.)]|uniref:predicted protein n=1 Tax=Ajellomyces capsulatus (strain NAm1 / WU24) TaxID=2059318 RepID=UPI000157CB0C|nr:predicted protein [Histoplasma mississippiense (nom. inval.)]EDN09139.1 predicted protein [Histoplasma mississippiense (nom. inval.)]